MRCWISQRKVWTEQRTSERLSSFRDGSYIKKSDVDVKMNNGIVNFAIVALQMNVRRL